MAKQRMGHLTKRKVESFKKLQKQCLQITHIPDCVGNADRVTEGEELGKSLGEAVGEELGKAIGEELGKTLGEELGEAIGEAVGKDLGNAVRAGEQI